MKLRELIREDRTISTRELAEIAGFTGAQFCGLRTSRVELIPEPPANSPRRGVEPGEVRGSSK